MNTMEITKIVGGLCGALLVFLLIQTGADAIIHGGEGGHDGEHRNAYVIEVAEADGAGDAEEEVAAVDFSELMAVADASAGERLYRACAACHKLEAGANAVGPYLHGVVGRDIASADGYSYSEALAGKDGAWDAETLSAFLENPKGWAPGTKMSYNGMRDAQDRANLIAYLDSASD